MHNNQQILRNDEIDLRELFKTIVKYKSFIILFTLISTLLAGVYVYLKNPTPVYSGQLLVEIGEIQSDTFGRQALDDSNDLSVILTTKFSGVETTPKGSLITIQYEDTDKTLIPKKIIEVFNFIMKRDQDKAKSFSKYTMTQKIGDITINDQPINKPKKKLIVAVTFVTSLIVSIFLVFFMEFIKGFKEEEK